jgi:hypothetical protein
MFDIGSELEKTSTPPLLIKAILSSNAVRNYTVREAIKDYIKIMPKKEAIEKVASELTISIDCVRHIIYKSKI